MVETISHLLGSLFAGASVLVAIWIYRRTEDRRAFAAFRQSLVDLGQTVHALDNLLAEPFFNDVSLKICEDLRELFPTDPSKEELKKYICADENHDFIAQAIHSGIQRSPMIARCDELVREIEAHPSKYREQLPVVASLLNILSRHIVHLARAVCSPRIFNEVIGEPKQFILLADASGFDADNVTDFQAFRHIGLMLGGGPGTLMQKGQRLFDLVEALIQLVADRFAGMSDQDLRTQSRRQRRMLKRLLEIDEPTGIDDAVQYFGLIRDAFEPEQWNEIISKATIVKEVIGDDE